jgi:hypothetical protein
MKDQCKTILPEPMYLEQLFTPDGKEKRRERRAKERKQVKKK